MQLLVVCDHALIGSSFVAVLKHHPTSEAWDITLYSLAESVARARELSVDGLLLDATSDFTAGLATIRELSSELPDVGIVVLGPTGDEGAVVAAVAAGADGYLAWDAGEDALVDALDAVLRGELGLTGQTARKVMRHLRQAAQRHSTRLDISDTLTTREQEIFDLVRQGKRSREIAEALCIADTTVYKHIQNILEKLHVRNRTQAIILAELDSPDASVNSRR